MRPRHVADADVEGERQRVGDAGHRGGGRDEVRGEQCGAVGQRRLLRHPLELGLGQPGRGDDGLQPLDRVVDVGGERGEHRAGGVAGRAVALGVHAHRQEADQRLLRQLVELGEEGPQAAAEDAENHVVEGGVVLLADAAEQGEVVLLPGETAVAADRAVEDRVRRLQRPDQLGPLAATAQVDVDQPRPSATAAPASLAANRTTPGMDGSRDPDARLVVRPTVERLGEEDRLVLRRVGGEAAGKQPHPAVTVDERVVHLDVHREPVALEPLDDVQLPQRPGQVERVAVQPRDEHAELRARRPERAGPSAARGSRCRGSRRRPRCWPGGTSAAGA